jgi:hypothetical protein
MNSESNQCPCKSRWIYGVSVLGAFLIVAALVWVMRHYTQPAPLNANRAAERANALLELRATESQTLNTTAWLDQTKGIVRLRIEDAMKLAGREWQHPATARSNLMARVEKANYVPPPAPAKPSAFE